MDQVSLKEMTEKESLMKHRNYMKWTKLRFLTRAENKYSGNLITGYTSTGVEAT